MTIYTSSHPTPSLPRQSLIHYLFPELSPECVSSGKASHGGPIIPGSTIAQIDPLGERQWTRAEVLSRARLLASGLRDGRERGMGLKRGQVVGVIGMNSLEWLNCLYGSLCAGLRVSPINYAYTPPELLHQLSHSGVSLVFVDPGLVPTLIKTLELGKSQGFVIPDDRIVLLCQPGKKGKHAKYRCLEEVYGEKEYEVERFENGDEDETCVMCYSSGTTGVAKGVETTHHNLTSQLSAMTLSSYPTLSPQNDITLAYLPLSHMYSFTLLVLHTLVSGAPMVVLPRFDERSVLDCIQRYGITFMLVVPPVLITFANSSLLDKYNLKSLKGVMSAAAPLSEDLCRAVEKRMEGLVVTQAYGLTETSPLSHILPLPSAQGRQSSIGQLVSTFTARLVDTDTGLDVPVNTPGELWLSGPSVMKGYYKNPAATKGTFSEDGKWFKTGDQARRDEGGYYYIEDRLKELIKYKGFQVAPAELEAVLLTHPKIADCAVIGVYVESQATELPRAYVVPKGGLDSIPVNERDKWGKEVQGWIKEQVANHKQLRGGVEVVESIPKSPSGKILRKNLRAALKEQLEREKTRGQGKEKAKAKL